MKKAFVPFASIIALALTLALVLTSYKSGEPDSENYIDTLPFPMVDSIDAVERYGLFAYPDNPMEALRAYLAKDITERGLPLEIGGIEQHKFYAQERLEFPIHFANDSNNLCLVSFHITDYEYGAPLSGTGNPSFTLAFKDPYNAEDMVTVLTSVITYLAPDLGLQEAERLARRQDATLSIDGFSIPQDIGGYQVQAHYTNPHVYFTTKGFSSTLAISITALKQIWRNEDAIDTGQCRKMVSAADFEVLADPYSLYDFENSTSEIVYAEFVVNDWWEYQEPLHGEYWTYILIESPLGAEYEVFLHSMRTPYEVGIGERYILFFRYYQGFAEVFHAVQLPVF